MSDHNEKISQIEINLIHVLYFNFGWHSDIVIVAFLENATIGYSLEYNTSESYSFLT